MEKVEEIAEKLNHCEKIWRLRKMKVGSEKKEKTKRIRSEGMGINRKSVVLIMR